MRLIGAMKQFPQMTELELGVLKREVKHFERYFTAPCNTYAPFESRPTAYFTHRILLLH